MIVDIFYDDGRLFHSDKIISNMSEAEIIQIAKDNLVEDGMASLEELKNFIYKVRAE